MNFYQTDTLSAVVARLKELVSENHACENTLVQLCNAGETALKIHTEDAYNIFMAECGSTLAKIKVNL
jgi:hypothetical protein